MVYDRAHTREIPRLGGMSKLMPWAAVGFIIGGLVSMGMPLFSGFAAEFPIFLGVWETQPWIAIVASISIVITASYILVIVRRVFFGEVPAEFDGHIGAITALDKTAIVVLCFAMVIIGLFPTVMSPLIQTGVTNIMKILGGA
jgi:NADH-quinone oxidoreductase subunit M